MRIDRLTVRNFRCFEERTFDFTPSFNLLAGENGSGKTAVLEAIALSLNEWYWDSLDHITYEIKREDARLLVQQAGTELTFEEVYPVSIRALGRVGDERVEWEISLGGPMMDPTRADELTRLALEVDRRVRKGKSVVLPLIAYYGTGRLWLEEEEEEAETQDGDRSELSRFEGYREAMNPQCSPRGLIRWLKRQEWITFVEQNASELYRVVKRAMAGMVEGATDVRYDPRREGVVLFFADREPQPFENLSDGQRNVLAMAGDIATRMARLNPHLGERALEETPGVVLIDELDLHLHPRWQRHLVEDLRRTFPRIQFVATSHSPFIIQTLRPGELILLDDYEPVPELGNLGIEEIAEGLMGVERPDVSPRYEEMVGAAKDYLAMLDEAATAPAEKLDEFERRLADRIAPYADNPAFQAFLEMKRVAQLGR